MIWLLLLIAVLIVTHVGAWVLLISVKNRVDIIELRQLHRDRGLVE